MSPGNMKLKKVQTRKSSKPKLETTEKPTPKEEATQSSNEEVVVVEEVQTKKPDLSLAWVVLAKPKFNEKEELEKFEVSDKQLTESGTTVTNSGTPVTGSVTTVSDSETPVTVSGTPVTARSVQKITPGSVR